tara:strand:- start:2748 stop:3668 length:921 start_codon:yes stop_codon:yes gene_type:complete
MAFGIIRARNLQSGDLASTDLHNARRYESAEHYPKNIDPKREIDANFLLPNSDYLDKSQTTLAQAVQARIEAEGVTGIRKNTNVAIEYVATINDQRAWQQYTPAAFFANTQKWLEKRHGKGSVVAVFEHYDESNPHAHFVVVPIIEKSVKWKNRRGEGERTEKRLNVRDHTGGPDKLRDLQNGYFRHLVETYGAGKNNKLGVPIYRGTLVENQTREYIEATDVRIGRLRAQLATISNSEARKSLEEQINFRVAEKAVKEAKLSHIEQQKAEKGKKWAFKGTKDNPDIFHGQKEEKAVRASRKGFGR